MRSISCSHSLGTLSLLLLAVFLKGLLGVVVGL
jgi:hypothetical protein